MPYSDYWDYQDVLESIKHFGSTAWDFATTPLLPEEMPEDWVDPNSKFGKGLKGFYKGVVRPYSAPVNLALLTPSYGTALKGVAKTIAGRKYWQPGLTRGSKVLAEGPEDVNRALYFSLLSSPATQIKAFLGGAGGTATHLAEKLGKGEFREAGRTVADLINPVTVARRYKAGFLHPTRIPSRMTVGRPDDKSLLSVPGRIMSGFDTVFTGAMVRGGRSLDEARRLTLTGTPETKLGQDALNFVRKFPFLQLMVPFPRVGIHAIEQSGLAQPWRRPIRALSSLGVGAAGAYFGDKVDPVWTPYASAFGGPFTLPLSVGLAARHAWEAGKNPEQAVVTEVARNIPYPMGLNPMEGWLPKGVARAFTPNILRDIARVQDPYERSTKVEPLPEEGGPYTKSEKLWNQLSQFPTTAVKIPGMREQLPQAGRRRDIYGHSIAGREYSPWKRFWTSEPTIADVTPDTPEAKMLEDIGAVPRVPRFSKEVDVPLPADKEAVVPLDPDIAELYHEEQAKIREPLAKALAANENFQRLDPKMQKEIAEYILGLGYKYNRQAARQKALATQLARKKGNIKIK